MSARTSKSTDETSRTQPARLTIVGVGGMGVQALNLIDTASDDHVTGIAIDTDQSVLSHCAAPVRLVIGSSYTRGHSTGGEPDLGRRSAHADFGKIRECFVDADIVLLVTGLGGGTGTGAAPLIAQTAREQGALVISCATLPFLFEGDTRVKVAEEGLQKLQESSQAVIVMPNAHVVDGATETTPIAEALQRGAAHLGAGFRLIWTLLGQRGLINLDFVHLKNMVETGGGACTFLYAEGAGRHKARLALSRILEHRALAVDKLGEQASAFLVGLLGSEDLTLLEVQETMTGLCDVFSTDAQRFVGVGVDPALRDQVKLAVWIGGKAVEAKPVEQKRESITASPAKKPVLTDRAKKRIEQKELDLETLSKGRFKDVEPTIYHGEDLDIPTFIRRGMKLTR